MIATCKVIKLGFQGDGVIDCDDITYHIPYIIAGETVKVRIENHKPELLEIIDASPHRIEPPCPYFGRCGGCKLQHLSQDKYRDFKLSLVPEANHITVIPAGTRRRVTFSCDGRNVGFMGMKSHALLDIDTCLLLKDSLNAILKSLKMIAGKLGKASILVTETDNGIDMQINKSKMTLSPDTVIFLGKFAQENGINKISVDEETAVMLVKPKITFSNVETDFPPGSFLQPCKEGEEALAKKVLEAIKKTKAKKVVDLFCGLGAFTYPLMKAGYKTWGYDIATVHPFIKKDLDKSPLTAKELNEFQAVVFDPPHTGAMRQSQNIAKSKVKAVIAVSCNPATFNRDRKILEAGGYTMQEISLVDQFTYSAHIELVALFTKK